MAILILIGIGMIVVAIVCFALAADPSRILRWRRDWEHIDYEKLITDRTAWERRERVLCIISGMVCLFCAIFCFALPSIQESIRQDRAARQQETQKWHRGIDEESRKAAADLNREMMGVSAGAARSTSPADQ